MELDAADWDDGRENKGWPECWILCHVGKGRYPYVVSRQRSVIGQAQQQGSDPKATMARLILDAKPGEVVIYLDGNPRNLRRSNLLKLDRKAAARWRNERHAAARERP